MSVKKILINLNCLWKLRKSYLIIRLSQACLINARQKEQFIVPIVHDWRETLLRRRYVIARLSRERVTTPLLKRFCLQFTCAPMITCKLRFTKRPTSAYASSFAWRMHRHSLIHDFYTNSRLIPTVFFIVLNLLWERFISLCVLNFS